MGSPSGLSLAGSFLYPVGKPLKEMIIFLLVLIAVGVLLISNPGQKLLKWIIILLLASAGLFLLFWTLVSGVGFAMTDTGKELGKIIAIIAIGAIARSLWNRLPESWRNKKRVPEEEKPWWAKKMGVIGYIIFTVLLILLMLIVYLVART